MLRPEPSVVPSRRPSLAPWASTIVFAALVGCGQKGPLLLPKSEAAPVAIAPSASAIPATLRP